MSAAWCGTFFVKRADIKNVLWPEEPLEIKGDNQIKGIKVSKGLGSRQRRSCHCSSLLLRKKLTSTAIQWPCNDIVNVLQCMCKYISICNFSFLLIISFHQPSFYIIYFYNLFLVCCAMVFYMLLLMTFTLLIIWSEACFIQITNYLMDLSPLCSWYQCK